MSFAVKSWFNKVGTGSPLDAPSLATQTPLDAAGLRDLEERLAGYTDAAAFAGGAGNARVLLWDADSENYEPAVYRTDTSYPREFVGPTDPATIGTVLGPVFGDRWTPTSVPG